MSRPLKFMLPMFLAMIALAPAADAGQALYTNGYFNGQVAGLSIGGDGTLTPLPGSPFTISKTLAPDGLAITPDGRTIVTSFSFNKTLGTRALAVDGSVSTEGPDIEANINARPAISPDGRFVYAGAQTGGVLTYSLGAGGSLTPVGTKATGNVLTESPTLTPDGRYLFLPGGIVGEIERFAVQSDGSPAPLSGENASVSGGPVHGMRVTPDGRFAIVLNVGAGAWVRAYSIGSDGSLSEVPSSKVELPDSSVAGPVVSPSGRLAYVSDQNDEKIHAFGIASDGKLAEIGPPVKAEVSHAQAMAISDDGRFLFIQPEDGEVVQAFAVAADGRLTKVGGNVKSDGGSDHTTPLPRPAVPKAAGLRPGQAVPGKATTFDAAGATDIGATITGYGWDFGDGVKETTAGPQANHAYKKAGVYSATVTVIDDAGCTGFVYTGQSAYCNGRDGTASATIDTLPVVKGLRLAAKKGKLFLAYKLEEKAKVGFTIRRKNGKKLRTIGVLKANGKPGKNKTKLPKKLKGKKLKPGNYVATAIATDSAGGQSAPAKAKFKLKRR